MVHRVIASSCFIGCQRNYGILGFRIEELEIPKFLNSLIRNFSHFEFALTLLLS